MVSAQPDRIALQGELALVMQSPEFVRSPVLRRLLEYLVDQTLSGHGDRLKAYQIAVDGLGRDDSFDPQSDSYPRVQVGRLRKMLDLHYAALSATQADGRQRITIPVGRYSVQLVPIVSALPAPGAALVRPDPGPGATQTGAATSPDMAAASLSTPALLPPPPASPALDRGWLIWAIPALLLLALLYGIWVMARPQSAHRDMRQYLAHVTIATDPASGNDDLTTAAQIAEMHLQRFEMLAVSTGRHSDGPGSGDTVREYQLLLRGAGRRTDQTHGLIFLTLRHAATGTTLWSYELPSSRNAQQDPPDIEQAIGSGISVIARSGGLIAQHQRKLIGNDLSPGYHCLIQYDAFRQRRDPSLRPALEACLTRSLELFPNEPLFLQALSYLALSAPQPNRQAPLTASERGRTLAEAALQFDGRSSLAQIAVARSALARGNCPRAIAFARRAVESNPLEPDGMAIAGTFLLSCGDNLGAEQALERALAMNSELSGIQMASLIIARLVNGKADTALSLALSAESPAIANQPHFLLAKALALAANRRDQPARAAWTQLERSVGAAPGTSPSTIMDRFSLTPFFSRRMVAEAQSTGLIGTAG